ncbi:glycosyltransferase family 39 protein [Candidatus Saccharibacteria bacterium]|nr:glycosyltransferase family 39 protein [Candidatus Saccharibacteria bacterium]
MKKHFSKFNPFILPLLAAVIFVCLAAINLRTSIWFDEAYSAYLIRGDYSQIWDMTAIDVHPPFYYFCLKTWSFIFGNSDFALRMMSVFFAAIGIVLAFRLLRRWFGDKTAGFATIFLAISPFLIRYGQEMRMYGLVFAIIMGATLALDVALKDKKKWAWALYAVLVALGMWTHYFTAMAWIAHVAYIGYYMCKHGLQKSVFWAYPLAVALFIPWMPYAIKQFTDVQGGFWIPDVSANTVAGIFTQGIIGMDSADVTGWFVPIFIAAVIVIIAIIIKTWKSFTKNEKANTWFLASLVLLPPLFLILMSLPPFKPTFVARYVTYSIALLMPLIALFLAKAPQIKNKTFAFAPMLLIPCCATIGIVQADTRVVENPTRDIIAEVQKVSSTPEQIFIDTDEMNYYDAFFYETAKNPVYGTNIDYKWGSLEPIRKYGQNDGNDIEAKIADVDSFWLIVEDPEAKAEFDGFDVNHIIDHKSYRAIRFLKKI